MVVISIPQVNQFKSSQYSMKLQKEFHQYHTLSIISPLHYIQKQNHMLNDEQKGIFINDFNDPLKFATYGLKG